MKHITAIYPGSFTPPTYGHFQIAKRAAEIFPHVIILCSTNENKRTTRWFSEEECREMWKWYPLPKNVSICTFSERHQIGNLQNVIMIRGIRNESDLEHEKKVVLDNLGSFGIDKYFYLCANDDHIQTSSTAVRNAARSCDLQTLAHCIAPCIVTKVLEKTMGVKDLYLVVGRPASGKTTFLSLLQKIDPNIVHINADHFVTEITPLIKRTFGENADVIRIALEQSERLSKLVTPLWLSLLRAQLQNTVGHDHVFVEIPYGLMPDKRAYRFAGGKILHISCAQDTENHARIIQRGTPEHAPFIDAIPNLPQSQMIAYKERLCMHTIDTTGDLKKLEEKAWNFYTKILLRSS